MKRNKSLTKVVMPCRDAKERSNNFQEVNLGYDAAMAREEAARCRGCRSAPCVEGCPVQVQIPQFLEKVQVGEFEEGYEIIRKSNSLPAVCGRVCPQESQCEKKCVRGKKGEAVAIGALERFCADYVMAQVEGEAKAEADAQGEKVAVIGSGPAGLTAAGDLIKLGYRVTIFEALHKPGGVLTYGIPEFRLPKDLVQKEISLLEKQGVAIKCNMVIGKTLTLKELKRDYGFKAIFIGSGAGLPNFMNIKGENLKGVYSANEFLTRINLMRAYDFPQADTPLYIGKSVAVVGGGNVAMDAARSAKRLGAATVYIIYRRSEAEMPARVEEIKHAQEEGVIVKTLKAPLEIIDDGKGQVCAMRCQEMELGEADESGRRRPLAIAGSDFLLNVDTVIIAIGNSPNPLLAATTEGLLTNERGCIIADEDNGATAMASVFAGGDAVTGAATVILAMGAGKKAAAAIHQYLTAKK